MTTVVSKLSVRRKDRVPTLTVKPDCCRGKSVAMTTKSLSWALIHHFYVFRGKIFLNALERPEALLQRHHRSFQFATGLSGWGVYTWLWKKPYPLKSRFSILTIWNRQDRFLKISWNSNLSQTRMQPRFIACPGAPFWESSTAPRDTGEPKKEMRCWSPLL